MKGYRAHVFENFEGAHSTQQYRFLYTFLGANRRTILKRACYRSNNAFVAFHTTKNTLSASFLNAFVSFPIDGDKYRGFRGLNVGHSIQFVQGKLQRTAEHPDCDNDWHCRRRGQNSIDSLNQNKATTGATTALVFTPKHGLASKRCDSVLLLLYYNTTLSGSLRRSGYHHNLGNICIQLATETLPSKSDTRVKEIG